MTQSARFAFRSAGIALVVWLAGDVSLRADEYTVSYNGGEGVKISYTNPATPTKTITNVGTTAESFKVTDTSTKPSTSFTAFCVDLYHTQSNGGKIRGVSESALSSFTSATLAAAFPFTAYTADLVSRLDYLGYVYNTLVSKRLAGDKEVMGAMQLALWTAIDHRFSYTSSDSVLKSDASLITALLGAPTKNGAGGSLTFELSGYSSNPKNKNHSKTLTLNLTGYSANAPSSTGKLILVHGHPTDKGYNQNLLTWSNGIGIQSVPEPSSLAFAGLGALAFAGYALRRRSKA